MHDLIRCGVHASLPWLCPVPVGTGWQYNAEYMEATGVERLRDRFAKLHTVAMRIFAWDDLRHFLAFARAGSMQSAARTLGVNQSTVQRRIAELEECVGHRLVERHLGSYRLTPLGEQLRPAAEGV